MEEYDTAGCDTVSRVVTGFMFLMAAGFVVIFILVAEFPVYATALMPVIIFTTWGFSTSGYSLEPGSLVIRRPFRSKTIRLDRDLTAESDPEAGKGAVKTMGNGGLFGYYGSFRSGRLGSFSAYVTDWKKGVVIRTGGKTIVVSPDEPELFIPRLLDSVYPGT